MKMSSTFALAVISAMTFGLHESKSAYAGRAPDEEYFRHSCTVAARIVNAGFNSDGSLAASKVAPEDYRSYVECTSFMWGFLTARGLSEVACPYAVSANQLTVIIANWYAQNPAKWNLPVGDAVRIAAGEAFACPKQ